MKVLRVVHADLWSKVPVILKYRMRWKPTIMRDEMDARLHGPFTDAACTSELRTLTQHPIRIEQSVFKLPDPRHQPLHDSIGRCRRCTLLYFIGRLDLFQRLPLRCSLHGMNIAGHLLHSRQVTEFRTSTSVCQNNRMTCQTLPPQGQASMSQG